VIEAVSADIEHIEERETKRTRAQQGCALPQRAPSLASVAPSKAVPEPLGGAGDIQSPQSGFRFQGSEASAFLLSVISSPEADQPLPC
jgi:hypothetical protein